MGQHNINDQELQGTKFHSKHLIKRAVTESFKNKLIEAGQGKSKMDYFLEQKEEWSPGKGAKYMNELTRKQTSLIFRARARMLKFKGNYKNGYPDLKCRMCKMSEETQSHILEECNVLHQNEASKVTKPQLFTEDTGTLREIASKIENILTKIE